MQSDQTANRWRKLSMGEKLGKTLCSATAIQLRYFPIYSYTVSYSIIFMVIWERKGCPFNYFHYLIRFLLWIHPVYELFSLCSVHCQNTDTLVRTLCAQPFSITVSGFSSYWQINKCDSAIDKPLLPIFPAAKSAFHWSRSLNSTELATKHFTRPTLFSSGVGLYKKKNIH